MLETGPKHQLFEAEDFGAEFMPELREQEERLQVGRAKSANPAKR